MSKNYNLIEPIETEYELNRGPRPSGYAKIKQKLLPTSKFGQGSSGLVIHADVEKIGKIRKESSYEKLPENKLCGYIPQYTQMAMSGIQVGCVEALRDSLDYPVTNVDIFVEEIVFDLVYSTEAAFYIASKTLLSLLLQKAKSEDLLK